LPVAARGASLAKRRATAAAAAGAALGRARRVRARYMVGGAAAAACGRKTKNEERSGDHSTRARATGAHETLPLFCRNSPAALLCVCRRHCPRGLALTGF